MTLTVNGDAVVDRLMREINEATSPEKMSQDEALEILEELSSRIGGSIDGLEDDIANSQEEN